MNEDQLRYIEDFGLLTEQLGLPRMVGRVLGMLLVSGSREHSAEELAETLRASRGSISSATRTLVQLGIVRRSSRPGERRDYFRIRADGWDQIMRQRVAQIRAFREMAARGLDLLNANDSDKPEARRGLEEMSAFFTYWEEELLSIFERWRQRADTGVASSR